MRLLIPFAVAALLFLLPEGGAASATTRLPVTPRHGGTHTTYTVTLKAPFAASKAAKTQYVLGMVNSGSCTRGVSSLGKVLPGPIRKGQTVRFVLRAPKHGWCAGVFHGVVHWEDLEHGRDVRLGRFGFRVLG